MSTSYIFLAGALFLFVIAIVILFMGKGKKDDKKVDKEFDENYAVNINEVYLRTGDVRETLVQMQDSYEDYNPLMSGLLGKAITYLDGDYGDYETALDMINVNHDETVDKVHKDIRYWFRSGYLKDQTVSGFLQCRSSLRKDMLTFWMKRPCSRSPYRSLLWLKGRATWYSRRQWLP